MDTRHFVIIGNGPAGNEAAALLREHAPHVRITVIGQEHAIYYRPNLLPDFIAGKLSEDELYVKPLEFYKEKDIKLRLGQKVIDVNIANREIILEHKEVIRFDGLIIATGGKPRIPEHLQVFEPLMLPLKTLPDAKAWIQKLQEIDSVLIVGGDLTSLCFTKALLTMGKKIFFMIQGGAFWPVRFDADIHDSVSRSLREKGVELIDSEKIKGITQISENEIVVNTETRKLNVGAFGAFFGLVPDVKFLARSGLTIERGIIVDERLRTRFEGVYAAGDCAQVYHPGIKDYWVSIGYRNAKNLGKVAALNLLGEQVTAEVAAPGIFQFDEITVNTSWWTEF